MNLRRTAAGILAAIGVSATLCVATPAQATTGYDRCAQGYFCVFTDLNGGGKIVSFQNGSADLRLQGVDGQIRSSWDRTTGTGEYWTGYTDYNYGGERGGLGLESPEGGPWNLPSDWTRKIHSLRPAPGVRR
ncbi:peptidase inhibitor family I36 protein [Nocardia sp. GAS34]|uniref:peptidase inhibitor family I36 protein n=1 Tax=unclassified Nocardia TaxID=2637762 RepID=UPI003D223051